MNARHARFVAEYVKDLNAKQAAIRAGYSPKSAEVNGPRLLRNAQIQQAVAQAQAKLAAAAEISAQWVIERLRREAEDMSTTGSPGARVKSLELIGRHLGLFEQTLNLKGKIETTPQANVAALTDEQLQSLQTALAPALAAQPRPGETEAPG